MTSVHGPVKCLAGRVGCCLLSIVCLGRVCCKPVSIAEICEQSFGKLKCLGPPYIVHSVLQNGLFSIYKIGTAEVTV